jgi:FHA domain-containing protein
MIVCTNCKHTNMTGAVFCSECGAPLLAADSAATHHITAAPLGSTLPEAVIPAPPPPVPVVADNWVTLHLMDSGELLPLAERNEFTVGRSIEGQPVMPDIDLTPYQAYVNGVSRLHAVIRRGVSEIYLMDLDSANGTFLNGKRLDPKEERPLSHGDVVSLGKLKIQILLKAS